MSEQVVGDAERHLAAFVELLDDRIILRVILKSTSGVNDTGEAEPVELSHKMTRRIHLVLRRQLWTFGERGVENRRVWPRNEQSGRIAFAVTLNFSARRIGSVPGITASAECRLVQQRAAIQVQDEYWRVGGGGVDFLQAWHPALGKLKFAPTPNHPHPLTRRRALCLFLQHPQSIRERRHAIPAELHVVVQAAANHMEMRVVEAGNDAAPIEVNDLCRWAAFVLLGAVHGHDPAIAYGDA